MRVLSIAFLMIFAICFGIMTSPSAVADEDAKWVKYVSWSGQVDDLVIFAIENERIRAIFPVSSGFTNPKIQFFAPDPTKECAAKLDISKKRGEVNITKQWWQRPDDSIRVQIIDEEPGAGDYEFTVFYWEVELTSKEKAEYKKKVDQAIFINDVHHMNKALEKDELSEALRWARGAYNIDPLNWDILNIMGNLNYQLNNEDNAVDIFIILRDYGHLTDENQKIFEELSPYESAKKPGDDEDEDEDDDEDDDDEDDDDDENLLE